MYRQAGSQSAADPEGSTASCAIQRGPEKEVTPLPLYRQQGEGNVFTGVCLSTIGGPVGTLPTGMLSCLKLF